MEFTTLDLVYSVLSVSILTLTGFLCYTIFQTGKILHNVNKVVEGVSEKLELIANAINFISKRVDTLTDKMGVLGTLLSALLNKFVVNKIVEKLEVEDQNDGKKKNKNKN